MKIFGMIVENNYYYGHADSITKVEKNNTILMSKTRKDKIHFAVVFFFSKFLKWKKTKNKSLTTHSVFTVKYLKLTLPFGVDPYHTE